jgi:hypoxanthine phosphoribosyltransferase
MTAGRFAVSAKHRDRSRNSAPPGFADEMLKNTRFKTAVSAARINRAVQQLARQIDGYYETKPVTTIMVVCVMDASFMFCADLVRRLKTPARIVFTKATSYNRAKKGRTSLVPIPKNLRGQFVLVVDTIYDTGKTIEKVISELRKQTRRITVAVLINKKVKARRALPRAVRFVGMELPGDLFLVGYGLDYAGEFRDWKDVRVLPANHER